MSSGNGSWTTRRASTTSGQGNDQPNVEIITIRDKPNVEIIRIGDTPNVEIIRVGALPGSSACSRRPTSSGNGSWTTRRASTTSGQGNDQPNVEIITIRDKPNVEIIGIGDTPNVEIIRVGALPGSSACS
jgi:hypothetical protein